MTAVELAGYTSRDGVRVADGIYMSTGTRRTDGRPVALKFAVATRGRRADAELHHEHQLLARLPGSVVRRAVALETTAEGATVLVLEHDEHEPISSVAGRLTPPELLALALRVCEAIAAVHAHGVIHGRLSPSNILIDPERRAVKLQGFTFASRIESAAPDAREPSPHAPAHELRYLAPEQTGRVNRGVDPRADLYALGVVLYELLAGRPAFPEEGAQELLHALLARTPTRLAELDPAIPQPLSDIIARLMAKDADERHEDAVQLITALSLVSAELEPRRPTRPRSPASALRSPPLTFGRARELARLHAELELARRGRPRLVAISGASGSGKSALARTLAPAVTARGGALVEGRFDALNHCGAFSTVIETLAAVARHALRLDAPARAELRTRLLRTLGPLAEALSRALPDARALLGALRLSPSAPGQREERRQRELALVRFISVYAGAARPVVLLLDDLQWADAATRRLVQLIISTVTTPGILIVCAFRPSTDGATDSLLETLETLARRELPVTRIELEPLTRAGVAEHLAEALGDPQAPPAGLSEWLLERSRGNPLELGELLGELRRRERLRPAPAEPSSWAWSPPPADELPRWRAAAIAEDALSLLPEETREALSHAACLGKRFELELVAAARGCSREQLELALAPAFDAAIIRRLDAAREGDDDARDDARFRHHLLRDAAYALTPAPERAALHLAIGQRLLARTDPNERADPRLVDIVSHMNRGQSLIRAAEEREELAALNLDAARQAKAASAHELAIELLNAGLVALQANPSRPPTADAATAEWPIWAPELNFALLMELAESHHAIGQLERAAELTDELTRQDVSPMLIARACALRTHVLASLGRSDDAIAAAVQAMTELGETLPVSGPALEQAMQREIEEVQYFIESRDPGLLLTRPIATDERHRLIIETLGNLVPAASATHEQLFNLCAARGVLLGIRHGYNEQTPFAYTLYGFIRALKFGEFESGFAIGELGHELNARLGAVVNKARLPFALALQAGFCTPVSHGVELLNDSIAAALESDDSMYLGFACSNRLVLLLAGGASLDEVEAMIEDSLRLMQHTGMTSSLAAQTLVRWFVARLRGRDPDGDVILDDLGAAQLVTRVRSTFVNGVFLLTRLFFALIDRDLDALDELLDAAERFGWTDGYYFRTERAFYMGMACAVIARERPERVELLARLDELRAQYERWADVYPKSHLARFELLSAERARARGDASAAIDRYDRAIAAARRDGNPIHEALACERAGLFHLKRGAPAIAYMYFAGAAEAYGRWGALAFSRRLDAMLESLSDEGGVATLRARLLRRAGAARRDDVQGGGAGLLEAARALSREPSARRLVDTLIQICARESGAERGVLMLSRGGPLTVAAVYNHESRGEATDDAQLEIPRALIEHVGVADEALVVDNALADPELARSPYVQRRRPRALLCVPLRHRERSVGALYLENTLTAGVFTRARVELVELLATQAALALLVD